MSLNRHTYFPGLPPHLVNRFYFDPSLGKYGGLVFEGSFEDDSVGSKYLLLNVLGTSDLETLIGLAATDDALKSAWASALTDQLTTDLQRFVEAPGKPGTYTPDLTTVVTKKAIEPAEVSEQNIAVDSYALTAVGPGSGYVTLISGNGLAFTPTEDPISIEILRVDRALAQGEVKIIQSSNPLSETLTLQQSLDFAGHASQFEFDWRIAPPVDGDHPPVYTLTRSDLLNSGSTWNHLQFPLPGEGISALPAVGQSPSPRIVADVSRSVVPVPTVPFTTVATNQNGQFIFSLGSTQSHRLIPKNLVQIDYGDGSVLTGTVDPTTVSTNIVVNLDTGQNLPMNPLSPMTLAEGVTANQPQAIVYIDFMSPPSTNFADLWLSFNLDENLGAAAYLDGQPVARIHSGSGDTLESSAPGDLTPLPHVFALPASTLFSGAAQSSGAVAHRLAVQLYSSAVPGGRLAFDAKLEAHTPTDLVLVDSSPWLPLEVVRHPDGV